MSERIQEWALDPWSDEPRWVAVGGRAHVYLFSKVTSGSTLDYRVVERHVYESPWRSRLAVFGPVDRVLPLLCMAEVAMVLGVWLARVAAGMRVTP